MAAPSGPRCPTHALGRALPSGKAPPASGQRIADARVCAAPQGLVLRLCSGRRELGSKQGKRRSAELGPRGSEAVDDQAGAAVQCPIGSPSLQAMGLTTWSLIRGTLSPAHALVHSRCLAAALYDRTAQHKAARHSRRSAQKEVKPFLTFWAAPAACTRSTLNLTVLDSGLRAGSVSQQVAHEPAIALPAARQAAAALPSLPCRSCSCTAACTAHLLADHTCTGR